jgi:hypothetical protein
MPLPQLTDRIKEAPAAALRAVFAGIGQLLLAADKIRNDVLDHQRKQRRPAGAGQPPGPESPPAAPEAAGNVRVLPDEATAPAAGASAPTAAAGHAAFPQPAEAPPAEAPPAEAPPAEAPPAEAPPAEAPPAAQAGATARPRAARAAGARATGAARPRPGVREAPAGEDAAARRKAPGRKPAGKPTAAAGRPTAAATPTPAGAPAPAAAAAGEQAAGEQGAGEQAAREQAAAGAAPLPNYDELTIPSLRARMRSMDAARVRALLDYERAHADRAPVVAMYERRLAKLAGEAS